MIPRLPILRLTLGLGLAASLAGATGAAGIAQASELSRDEIVRQLAPTRPLTRSMGPIKHVDVLPGQEDRALADTAGMPAINLRVLFRYDSDALTPEGRAALAPLGEALVDPRLAASHFLIGGHTDAYGSAEYNQGLSERRARSVREYLVATYAIPPERLQSLGFGKRKLADPARPDSPVNRRVEVINISQ